jgi:hypothetical protein
MKDLYPEECKENRNTYGNLRQAFTAFYLNDASQAEAEIKKIMHSNKIVDLKMD